jgi:hypothetical protein
MKDCPSKEDEVGDNGPLDEEDEEEELEGVGEENPSSLLLRMNRLMTACTCFLGDVRESLEANNKAVGLGPLLLLLLLVVVVEDEEDATVEVVGTA